MLSAAENELLTRVGRGTPMGGMMRRYWLPVCTSAQLPRPDGPPLRLPLLGESYVAFRDTSGKVGLLEEFCMHRRASLWLGRVEDNGIRCLYHGWKFGADGTVQETPNHCDDRLKARWAPAFPTREAGGLVWAYVGPKENQPPFQRYEFFEGPEENRCVFRINTPANYLQLYEGGTDSSHVGILHCNLANPEWKNKASFVPEAADYTSMALAGRRQCADARPGEHPLRLSLRGQASGAAARRQHSDRQRARHGGGPADRTHHPARAIPVLCVRGAAGRPPHQHLHHRAWGQSPSIATRCGPCSGSMTSGFGARRTANIGQRRQPLWPEHRTDERNLVRSRRPGAGRRQHRRIEARLSSAIRKCWSPLIPPWCGYATGSWIRCASIRTARTRSASGLRTTARCAASPTPTCGRASAGRTCCPTTWALGFGSQLQRWRERAAGGHLNCSSSRPIAFRGDDVCLAKDVAPDDSG